MNIAPAGKKSGMMRFIVSAVYRTTVKEFVRANPTQAVFTALGVGFVLGLIFRR
jgi:ElaB/YqjD/DUF883 family membrane-anchored ribosome-binding protein